MSGTDIGRLAPSNLSAIRAALEGAERCAAKAEASLRAALRTMDLIPDELETLPLIEADQRARAILKSLVALQGELRASAPKAAPGDVHERPTLPAPAPEVAA
ncbi:MAG: hypothetical protein AAGH15_10990 [Myxococcota bacterium]